MPPLEGDEEKVKVEPQESIAERVKLNPQKYEGTELKILTPNKLLTRLPILLAQIKAWNNSYKSKNEIRQILYLLYQISKKVYNNLIKLFNRNVTVLEIVASYQEARIKLTNTQLKKLTFASKNKKNFEDENCHMHVSNNKTNS